MVGSILGACWLHPVSILQMWSLRLREIGDLLRVTQLASKRQSWGQTRVRWAPDTLCPTVLCQEALFTLVLGTWPCVCPLGLSALTWQYTWQRNQTTLALILRLSEHMCARSSVADSHSSCL